MKRITFFLVTLFCSLVTFAATSGKCGDNLTWKYDIVKKTLTISGTGQMYDYGYSDWCWAHGYIPQPWNDYDEEIITVVINKGVTSIGRAAFRWFKNMTFVSIPIGVTSIGGEAFYNCEKVKSITLPEGLKTIGYCAFGKCEQLVTFKIPNSVTTIGNSLFYECHNLTEVQLPTNIKSISKSTFAYCFRLASIEIPQSVTNIEENAFGYCYNLSGVEIPDGVTEIGERAFKKCKNLKYVLIPRNVKKVGLSAFDECENLQEVIYPQGLSLFMACIPQGTKLTAYESSQTPPCVQPSQPPLLALVDGSLQFSDANANNRIDAEEKCTVKFRVANNGKGAATNCEARVKLSGATNGITVNTVRLPAIAAGNNYEVSVPVTSNINTINGQVSLAIEIYEPNGFGVEPFAMNVSTKAYDPPYLQIVDYQVSSVSGKIRKMEPFIVTCNLQNTKYGNAENVTVHVNIPANIFLVEGEETVTIPQVKSGEVVNLKFGFLANTNYNTGSVPITFEVKEKHGKFAENKQLAIALNQTSSSTINIAAKEEAEQERKEIQLAMMTSDVDRNIPVTKAKNPNTFVLIIANEHYQQVASVPFALNDGNIFREYCIKTLGIGEKHIHYVADATGNQIKAHINWLANITETWDDAQVIVYYAGHGIPDEASKSAYLLPVDGSGTDVTTGYKLDDLYATLGNMPASQITVFMDACFSGSKREQGMLASARGVAIKAKSGVPQGKMVVFSAAQGDETAYPNNDEGHGIFTYYLLKKLQETKGDVSLKELGDYVTKQVSQQSLLINSKKQTPCVTPSAEVGTDWENWKLK